MIAVTNFHGLSLKDIKNKIRINRKDPRMYERWLCINASVEGHSIQTMALLFDRNEDTLREWIKDFNKKGEEGLQRDSPPGAKKN